MLGDHVDTRAPDSIEPMVGWRTWDTARNFGRQALVSPSQGHHWPHRQGQYMTARCAHTDQERQAGGCHCGINAWDSIESMLADKTYSAQPVWGTVKVWGEINVFAQGIRGECAYPGELFVDPSVHDAENLASELAATYQVPVSIKARPPVPEGPKSSDPVITAPSVPGDTARLKASAALTALALVLGTWMIFGEAGHRQHVLAALDLSTRSAPILRSIILGVLTAITGCLFPALLTVTGLCAQGKRAREIQVMMIMAVSISCLSGFTWTAVAPNFYPGHARVQLEPVIKAVNADGKPRSVRATTNDHAAWAWEYRYMDNGACDTYSGVVACRKGDVIDFTKGQAVGQDKCTTDRALGVRACPDKDGAIKIKAVSRTVSD